VAVGHGLDLGTVGSEQVEGVGLLGGILTVDARLGLGEFLEAEILLLVLVGLFVELLGLALGLDESGLELIHEVSIEVLAENFITLLPPLEEEGGSGRDGHVLLAEGRGGDYASLCVDHRGEFSVLLVDSFGDLLTVVDCVAHALSTGLNVLGNVVVLHHS